MAETQESRSRQQMIQEIFADSCDDYGDQLYVYAEALVRDKPAGNEFVGLVSHLKNCAFCSSLLSELKEQLTAEVTGNWFEMPDFVPSADKIDLPVGWPIQITPFTFGVTHLQLDNQLRKPVRFFLQAVMVREKNTPAMALRGVEEGSEEEIDVDQHELFSLEMPVLIKLKKIREAGAVLEWQLLVEITVPERWPDFSGVLVTVHWPGRESSSVTTDSAGVARFSGFRDPDLLAVQIEIHLPDPDSTVRPPG